ncbi:thioredoxin family protein [Egibacter rhizosphaerae]|uniref:Thioredoxin family protein n=1 Tax=Egibacter rhizosphaerae TaxID=1670831 RepID=A0A411YC59_9ACTN|nr:thioredoxin family protein [Egibacter rhizosphaerae]QBI18794.1 thioredoxin family protein [Egibacter rhizosphaerae]
MTTVRLLYFDGCPNWQNAEARLRALQAEAGFELERQRVETAEDAERLGFRGSPTVLVDGVDPFADGTAPIGLACRVYATSDGLHSAPTVEQLRAVLT